MNINGNAYFFDRQSCKLVTGPVDYQFDTYQFTDHGTEGKMPYIYTQWDSNGNLLRGEKFAPTHP